MEVKLLLKLLVALVCIHTNIIFQQQAFFGGRLRFIMKKVLILLFIGVLSAACSRPTSTPQPTEPALNFPTPVLSSVPECAPSDLLTSASSNPSIDGVMLGLTLTNKSGASCKLTNPPQALLLDANNETLAVQNSPLDPIQTPPAPLIMVLAPNDSTIITLVWRNYCQPLPGDKITIRLTLAQNNAKVEVKLPAPPQCNAKDKPSTIIVAPYSNPP
jgi:hypothetical protein